MSYIRSLTIISLLFLSSCTSKEEKIKNSIQDSINDKVESIYSNDLKKLGDSKLMKEIVVLLREKQNFSVKSVSINDESCVAEVSAHVIPPKEQFALGLAVMFAGSPVMKIDGGINELNNELKRLDKKFTSLNEMLKVEEKILNIRCEYVDGDYKIDGFEFSRKLKN